MLSSCASFGMGFGGNLGTGFAAAFFATGFERGFASGFAGGLGCVFFAGCLATGGFATTFEPSGGGGAGFEEARGGRFIAWRLAGGMTTCNCRFEDGCAASCSLSKFCSECGSKRDSGSGSGSGSGSSSDLSCCSV